MKNLNSYGFVTRSLSDGTQFENVYINWTIITYKNQLQALNC